MLVWPMSSPKMTRMLGRRPVGPAGLGAGAAGCACATAAPPDSAEAASAVPPSRILRRSRGRSLPSFALWSLMCCSPSLRRLTGRTGLSKGLAWLCAYHGNESGLTGRQPEELSKILGIPSGAFAAPLEAPLIAGLPHEVESEVAHDRHVLGSMPRSGL